MQQASDHELLSRIQRGDSAALNELFERHAAHCLALAERVGKDSAEAEDVVQDVFVRLWEGRGSQAWPSPQGSVRAWLLTSTRNRAIDHLRHEDAQSRVVDRAKDTKDHYARPPGRISSTIAHAMDDLPFGQKEVVELAYFEGLTQAEIADRLGQPHGTVKSRLRLGMSKLRTALEQKRKS